MSGYFWAQPDYQRITSPHINFEREMESKLEYSKNLLETPEEVRELIAMLETGPKSSKELKKHLNISQSRLETLLTSATRYEKRMWQIKLAPIESPNHRGTNYYGLGDTGELPPGEWILT